MKIRLVIENDIPMNDEDFSLATKAIRDGDMQLLGEMFEIDVPDNMYVELTEDE